MKAKKIICLLVAAMMLWGVMALSEENITLRTLRIGDSGDDVLQLKQALAALGYMKNLTFSAAYTDETAKKVLGFQADHGLTPTGEADDETQRLACELAGIALASAVPSPDYPADENGYPLDMPPRDENGFLLGTDQTEYRFSNESAGLWLYATPSLSIEIRRMEDKAARNVWFECDIHASAASPLLSKINWSATNRKNTVGYEPVRCALDNGFVLCLSDDHFGARMHAGSRLGVCIRDGVVIADDAYSKTTSGFPNLDVLALFEDGSMKAFANGAHTAAEYLAMGAVDTFSFGPVLVSGGQINELVRNRKYHYVQEPRCALGMIEPYHYLVLVVNGRTASGKGVRLDWLAEKMLEKGVQEAINLDGGGTASLVFLGQRLNRTGSSVRSLYSCIGFGRTELNP